MAIASMRLRLVSGHTVRSPCSTALAPSSASRRRPNPQAAHRVGDPDALDLARCACGCSAHRSRRPRAAAGEQEHAGGQPPLVWLGANAGRGVELREVGVDTAARVRVLRIDVPDLDRAEGQRPATIAWTTPPPLDQHGASAGSTSGWFAWRRHSTSPPALAPPRTRVSSARERRPSPRSAPTRDRSSALPEGAGGAVSSRMEGDNGLATGAFHGCRSEVAAHRAAADDRSSSGARVAGHAVEMTGSRRQKAESAWPRVTLC
jgi:hypothetical protein